MRKTSNYIKPNIADGIKLNTVILSFKLLNFLLRALKAFLFRTCKAPSRILVFRTGSLGDSLCAIPTIAGIRRKYKDATIDLLTHPGKATLVSIDQLLSTDMYDQVINYSGLNKRQIVAMLKKRKYDLVIQLPQANAKFWHLVRDTVFYRLIAPSGWGWQIGKIVFYKKLQEKFIKYDTEVIRIAKIAEKNGILVDINDFPLNITENDVNFVEEKFRLIKIQTGKVLGIAIGAKRPQNRWPVQYVKKIIQIFYSQCDIVIIGGREDYELASQLCIFENVHNLCGSFTPMQSAVALKKCTVFLSNDTGPMHLSYAVGTPTVATFTSRDFIGTWFPPENDRNIVFRSDNIPCSICLSEYCANNICIQAISPSLVSAAISKFIYNSKAK